jgi:hypothetical protein
MVHTFNLNSISTIQFPWRINVTKLLVQTCLSVLLIQMGIIMTSLTKFKL